jgi:hypothetical protein
MVSPPRLLLEAPGPHNANPFVRSTEGGVEPVADDDVDEEPDVYIAYV